jgi:hypothetical protein
MGKWVKLGLVWRPSGRHWWARDYAHMPTPELLDERTVRVYFACLDDQKFGRPGWVDLDARDPTRVLREAEESVLDLGQPGTFDDSGVVPSCFAAVAGRRCLYYIGWQRCERVPYQMFTGLAEPENGGFRRASAAPLIDRTGAEPFVRANPTIRIEGGRYRAWYVSATGWTTVNDNPYPSYVIRHSESADGLHWSGDGPVCIGHDSADEFGISRPWVIRDADCYRMWYAVRSRSAPYRIGYAEAADGLAWVRKDDQVGIHRGDDDGWDSQMICFPAVLDVNGKRLMFYNGNRHGATGFGVAVLE